MKPLVHLAARIFDTPHLIAPHKFEVILGVLGPRLGLGDPLMAAGESRAASKAFEVTPDGIAIIPVEGTLVHKTYGLHALSGMRSYTDIQREVGEAAQDPAVRAILLNVDSPGGEVAGAFDAADAIYAARSSKPVFAVANNDAFSGGYLLASAADRIYVSRTSGVGSIGVIFTHLDMTGNDEKNGFKYTIVHAGARKADFHPHTALSEEARQVLEAEVERTFGLLVGAVARNRGLSESAIRATEAALFYGSDAVNVKLADRMGTRQDALADLRVALGQRSTKRGGTRIMTEELEKEPAVDLEALRVEARKQGYAEAREIVDLCTLAGMPSKAAGLLARGASPAEARQFLMEARVAEDAVEIRSHVLPETGTTAKPSLENNPVIKAVERLAAKGVN
jgi:signal peptide peptidase SppA